MTFIDFHSPVHSDEADQNDTFDPRSVVWVESPSSIKALKEHLRLAGLASFDTETTGLDEYATSGGDRNGGVAARIAMATFTVPVPAEFNAEPTNYVVPLSHPQGPFVGSWRSTLADILEHCLEHKVGLIAQNGKFDSRWCYAATGLDISGNLVWDTMLSSGLLDENQTRALKPRAAKTFDIEQWNDGIDFSKPGEAERIDYHYLGLYGVRDTYWVWKLARHQILSMTTFEIDGQPTEEEIVLSGLYRLMTELVQPTFRTITKVEQRGIYLDPEGVQREIEEQEKIIQELEPEVVNAYPVEEEYGTPSLEPVSKWFKRWAELAVEADEFVVIETTPSGHPSWGAAVLKKLQRVHGSELAGELLELRAAKKKLQFLKAWLGKVTRHGKIHANYNVGRTVTGRLSCVAGDTLIDMPRDMTRYPDGVPISEVKAGDWVYSFDKDLELTLRQVSWVGPTKVDRTIFVTFENSDGEQRVLQCTPDHLVRLYNGDYRHAEYLLKNANNYSGGTSSTRVLAMVRRGWKDPNGNDQYLQFFPHSNSRHTPPSVNQGARYGSKSGGKNLEHRWVLEKVLGKKLSTKWDVNHIDGNKVNNHPSNLEYLPASEHRSNSHRDGTRGKPQPGTETYIGPNDFRVVSIESGPVIEVWDMTVPEDHCFVANGIVVHNSSDPNMQQVTRSLKPAFSPSPGYYLAEIDYSQIELRVAAHISGSKAMIEAYREGQDLHKMIAARTARISVDEVTKEQRQAGKAANFGLIYGMSAEGFQNYAEAAYGVEMTLEEATKFREEFFKLWDGLIDWHHRMIDEAAATGQVISPLGRVRRLPDIRSNWVGARSDAERQAINSPVQGMASDMMMLAASAISGEIKDVRGIPEVRMVGTVHDSILVEVPQEGWEFWTREVMRYMTEEVPRLLDERFGVKLAAPLECEATVGSRWGLDDVGTLE